MSSNPERQFALSMVVIMTAPKIAHAKTLIAVKGFEISPIVFKNTGGAVSDCSINPALPLGLQLSVENKTCVLSGTPLQLSARALYIITASNSDGSGTASIEIAVVEAAVKTQREAIIHEHDQRGDLDTPRSQIENAMSDQANMNSIIKPHEKFATQPMGDDKRLSQQTDNNPDAEQRAQNTPELAPAPTLAASLQHQHQMKGPTPSPRPGG